MNAPEDRLHDRFSTKNRHSSARIERPFRARNRHMQRSKLAAYSITSSARVSSVGGPIAFATIRLTTRSNLVGRSTGRSADFAPAKSCRTKSPARPAEVDEGHRADEGREFLFFV